MKLGTTWRALLALNMALPALAQDDELEEVVVTGSYCHRVGWMSIRWPPP